MSKQEDDEYKRVKTNNGFKRLNTTSKKMRESMQNYVEKSKEEYEKVYGFVEQESKHTNFKEDYLGKDSVP